MVINVLATCAYVLVLLFVVSMFVRVVFDVVQMAARQWRPQGLALIAAEVVYSTTDPPLRLVRRFIPPLRFGGMALDLAFLLVLLVAWVAMGLLGVLATA